VHAFSFVLEQFSGQSTDAPVGWECCIAYSYSFVLLTVTYGIHISMYITELITYRHYFSDYKKGLVW
jgi:hypothetical protein